MTTKTKNGPPSEVILQESRAANLVVLDAANDNDKKRFSMLAYTGAEVSFWGERAIFNVAGMKIASQRSPILRQHDPDRIAGFSEKIEKDECQIKMEGILCPSTDAGREVCALGAEGFPWQASVGLSDVRWDFLPEGKSKKINGQDVTGPIYVAAKSVLRESSFVPLGADGATKGVVLSAASRPFTEEGGITQMDRTDVEAAEAQKAEAEKKIREDTLKVERERVSAIQAAFKDDPEFAMAQVNAGADLTTAKAAYADRLAKRNADLQAENAALKAQKDSAGVPPVPLAAGEPAEATDKPFIELAREYAKANHVPLHKAMSEISAKNTKAYAANDPNLAIKKAQVNQVTGRRGLQTFR